MTIGDSLMNYYLGIPAVITILGAENVFLHKAPPAPVVLPWIVIDVPTPGPRKRLTVAFVNPVTNLHILCESDDAFFSNDLAELLVSYTDFYRGDLFTSEDVYLRCGTIYTMDGYAGAVTSAFQVKAEEKTALVKPAPVGA